MLIDTTAMNVPTSESSSSTPIGSLGLAANLACLWEATAAKPGNVNRNSDFEDLTLVDFLASGAIVADTLNQLAWQTPTLGRLVLEMVRATRTVCSSNSNLGICLLLAPLSIAHQRCTKTMQLADPSLHSISQPVPADALRTALQQVIESATVDDTRDLYQAISLSLAGGLGTSDQADVHSPNALASNDTPLQVMTVAKDRDAVAYEYASCFSRTFEGVLPSLLMFLRCGYPMQWAIIGCQIQTMAMQTDTLIERKLGKQAAEDVRKRCQHLWQNWSDGELEDWKTFQEQHLESTLLDLQELDFYLRCDGHRRNPGTTADLIAAALFTGLITGQIPPDATW